MAHRPTPPRPDDGPLAAARTRLARRVRLSRAALIAERIAQAFWPVWTLAAAFLGVTLAGLFEVLPRLAHWAVLGAFAAALVALGVRAVRRYRSPTAAEALARLEADAPDGPASTLEDEVAVGADDPVSRAVWRRHQQRMAERALALKARAPDPHLSRRDPMALRVAALLVLAIGLVGAAGDGGRRLQQALTPGLATAPAVAPSVEAWASPPTYTGAPVIYLTERADGAPIPIPQNSDIAIRVFNADEAPALTEEVSGQEAAFKPLGDGAHDAAFRLVRGGRVAASLDGAELAGWTFRMIPDQPPRIAFASEPGPSQSYALQFDFETSDDYGVTTAWATIELDAGKVDPALGPPPEGVAPIEIDLPLPFTGSTKETTETLIRDLTEHPWAGLPVKITLYAQDAAGQVGHSAPKSIDLPARRFYEPMAKALVEQRRAMAWSLANAPRALSILKAVTAYPDEYFDWAKPYLLIRTAIRRLDYAIPEGRLDQEIESVLAMLWNAALMLEEGDLSNAAERLRRAQERLSEAIENGATDEEIARLMQELREAMQDYMEELARNSLQNLDQLQAQDDRGQRLSQDMLDNMLRELERAMQEGRAEDARRMLEQLRQMMENLRMARPQPGQQGQEMMQGLNDMLEQQQDLANRSFEEFQRRQGQGQPTPGQEGQRQQQGQNGQQGQQGRQGQQGQPGEGQQFGQGDSRQPGQNGGARPGETGRLAQEQEALRRMLDDLRRGIPNGMGEGARRSLDDADQAMGGARDSLNEDRPGDAVDDQVRAMEALRESARRLNEEIQQAQRGQGDQAARRGQNGAEPDGRDPFGRPTSRDGSLEGDVEVPTSETMKRARELLDEIRRRSGDRTRPKVELDYLERLLERF